MSEAAVSTITEDEYLALEAINAARYEFVGGRARLMAGASLQHNEVTGSLYMVLRAQATGTGCRVFMENARLRVNAQRYYYPDVMVTCVEQSDSHHVTDPCLIVEVLSPTTADIDRGEKRMAYLQMPSLRHFLLVHIEAGLVEHLERSGPDAPWLFHQANATMMLQVDCPAPTTIDVGDLLSQA